MNHKSRVAGIDALRGLAASFVVLWHLAVRFYELHPQYPRPALDFGNGAYGVWLFFAISGYVIPMTLERVQKPSDFALARAMRLYPTFMVSAIITFSIVHILGLPGFERTFGELLGNLTMLPHFLGIETVDDVYWTLETEWFFYALIFGVLAFNLRGKMTWIATLMLTPIFVASHLASLHPLLKLVIGRLHIVENIHYFVPGMCIYYWNKDKNKVYLFILAAFFVITWRMRGTESLFVGLVNVPLLYLASNGLTRWLEVKPLLFLGTISYSLYLIHNYIGFAIMIKMLDAGVNPNVCVAAAIVFTVALATLVSFYVEQPTTRWYKEMFSEKKLRVEAIRVG
jgi:peptidoglycan/LPS O-acetylase OafA/YrhL